MKKCVGLMLFFLCGCASVQVPASFAYREIHTPYFTLAAWVKDSGSLAPLHIYIEGDGRAYTANGYPSSNPTPKHSLMRQMAFADTAENVAYVARPCQFVKDPVCTPADWTTARFSARAVQSMASALQTLAAGRAIEMYAHSGGALLSGLVIVQYPQLPVQKWTTYAGLLNHTSWTARMKLAPLSGSLDLTQLPDVPQVHYAGEKDRVILPELSRQWTAGHTLIIVPRASHRGPF